MMDKEVLNPFTFNCESNVIINLHLRNKSLSFVDCSDEEVNHCSVLIKMMCGKVKKSNPDYYLTSKKSNENVTYILVDWIYALQGSTSYVFPQDFLANLRVDLNSATPESVILLIKDKSNSFQYSMSFLQDAYAMMKSQRYSYPRLKRELELIDKYSILRDESLQIFVDACQIGFSQIRTQKKLESDVYNYYQKSLTVKTIKRKIKDAPRVNVHDFRNSI